MQANSKFLIVEKQRFFVQRGQSFSLFFFHRWRLKIFKGPGKGGHTVADTLLPTQTFPRLPARNICCGHKFAVNNNYITINYVLLHRQIKINTETCHGLMHFYPFSTQHAYLLYRYIAKDYS